MTVFIQFAMVDGVVDVDGNSTFQNQIEDVARSLRSAARKVASSWKELLKKKPRGQYFAFFMSDTSAEFEANHRRSTSNIADATKELESLAGYTFLIRMQEFWHYICTILSWLMLCHPVLPRIRAALSEAIGEEAIIDKCNVTMHV